MGATKPRVSALLLLLCGCKAQPTAQGDGAMHDLAPDDGGGGDAGDAAIDLASADLTQLSDLSCPKNAVEICGNGCDDDRNGYTDDDDPACTPQIVATWEGGSATLQRLVLQPPFSSGFLDGNIVPSAARGVYVRSFAPGVAFVLNEGAAMQLQRITLPPNMMGMGATQTISLTYSGRDVCVFNGELIVVEYLGRLHRLQANGTENGTVQLPAWSAADTRLTACASDGVHLYVAEHFGVLPSQFEILDTGFMPAASPVPISDQLLNNGIDRCLDFAWTSKGFFGLFVNSGGAIGDNLSADELAAFSFDGGVGPPLDAGKLHGIGEFVP
jgi:hypothetical protein